MTEASKRELPPGWYASTNGEPTQQYWDGERWTGTYKPMLRPPMDRPYIIAGAHKTSHAFHLIMTIITVGLWLPIWILVAVYNSVRKD